MTRTVERIKAALATLAQEKAQLKAMDRVQNEGEEGYNAYETKGEEIALKEQALYDELFAIEWTAKVTETRRAAWNSEMQKLIAAKKQISAQVLAEITARVGFTMADLKKAKALHRA